VAEPSDAPETWNLGLNIRQREAGRRQRCRSKQPENKLFFSLWIYLSCARAKQFIIWAGTAPPLSRYVTYLPTFGIHLDSPRSTWRIVRLVSAVGPHLSKHIKDDARWVAPFPWPYRIGIAEAVSHG
jgi:hypothetical protein